MIYNAYFNTHPPSGGETRIIYVIYYNLNNKYKIYTKSPVYMYGAYTPDVGLVYNRINLSYRKIVTPPLTIEY